MASSSFVAFGNPLLDIVTTVTPEEETRLVNKYRLARNVGQEIETSGLMREIQSRE